MSVRRRFFTSSTVTVDALAHDIWALWVDVNGWSAWDRGVESALLHSNFKQGNRFTLVPKGAEAVEVTIKTVTQGDEFSDEANLPFGTIRTFHRMEPFGELVKVTHEVEAEVDLDHAPAFSQQLWADMQRNVSESLNDMIDIVSAA